MTKPPIHLETREADKGARQKSPSAGRNREVIGKALSAIIPQGGAVLEIASGTGEHALHMCQLRPDLTWQPSDPNAEARASQDDWAREADGRMLPSVNLDVSAKDWENAFSDIGAIFCANMIHIAPWSAAKGLASGAGKLLSSGGKFILYGPFLDGARSAPSNLQFDTNLKVRNPVWGVRNLGDVKHIFALAGLAHQQTLTMPKNNLILVFERS